MSLDQEWFQNYLDGSGAILRGDSSEDDWVRIQELYVATMMIVCNRLTPSTDYTQISLERKDALQDAFINIFVSDTPDAA